MTPSIFPVVAASPTVQAVLGTNPVRFFPFGQVKPEYATSTYAVHQIISGSPENYLNQRPDIDRVTIQIDAYADTGVEATAAAVAIRDAVEGWAYVVSWRGTGRDDPTGRFRASFDVSWWEERD